MSGTRLAAALLLYGVCPFAALEVTAALADSSAAPALTSADPQLAELMRQLAGQRYTTAHFEQSQWLNGLTRPLKSAGTLSYRAPDHLEERIETPRAQRLVLDHGVLSLQLGRHRRSVALADYPELAPWLDSLRALLAGDLPALQQHFALQLSGPLSQWQLQMKPLDPSVQARLQDIRVRGRDAQIEELQLEQSDGEHSLMRIEPDR
ncbi:MAG TPA: LolA-related protein [Steroidobacteraceae bacterium]|nr:LolA-related protein [Steroidobacteraceae bacterium]